MDFSVTCLVHSTRIRHMRTIQQATQSYESWVSAHCRIHADDLRAKHRGMASDLFPFLRATFYRWAELFQHHLPELARSPRVLGVGDPHIENFGTWRDTEGRLVWGINDFDEACPLPYTNDLVRLAASAWIAGEEDQLSLGSNAACRSILQGFRESLESGGRPFVLSENNRWLREAVTSRLRDPARFWGKLVLLRTEKNVPREVLLLLAESMPVEARRGFRIVHRQAGLGSLGRSRFTALAEWQGGWIAREAKSLLPSVWGFPQDECADEEVFYQRIVKAAVRSPDPFVAVHPSWLLRRLSPYCSRIELRDLPRKRDEARLLYAMGWELANVHLGTPRAGARLTEDLRGRESRWLTKAAELMVEATRDDWRAWRDR